VNTLGVIAVLSPTSAHLVGDESKEAAAADPRQGLDARLVTRRLAPTRQVSDDVTVEPNRSSVALFAQCR
jgi:hypothetical protein